jgi:hypothetical protein
VLGAGNRAETREIALVDEERKSRQGTDHFRRLHVQNNQSKMDWRCGSSGRVLHKQYLSSNPSLREREREQESTGTVGMTKGTEDSWWEGLRRLL